LGRVGGCRVGGRGVVGGGGGGEGGGVGGWIIREKLGIVWGVRPASQKPYPIYDQNLRFSISFHRPAINKNRIPG